MKYIFTLISLLYFSTAFSQWTRVEQLPASDIFTVYHKDNILYAGGRNVIYLSKDNGQSWDSTNAIPNVPFIDNIIVYKNELYASAPHRGAFKSIDEGITWQIINGGLFPDVSDFCEFNGDLYAATYGNSVYKLNPVNRSSWISFSNGLSSLSANITSITGNSNAMVAGTLANGLYDHIFVNSTTWEERFLRGRITPTEGVYDIITGNDTLFLTGHIGRIYMSTDNGLRWNPIGDVLFSLNSRLVNAKEAVLLSNVVFDGQNFITIFHYIKKDSLQNPFVLFSVSRDHYTYKIDILGNRIWDASTRGLFYMSLSDLPRITAADSELLTSPVRFTEFNTACENKGTLITWKTSQEQNSSHFEIEKSGNGITWTVLGRVPAAGNSNTERNYSFTDTNPKNSFYRIAEHGLDGRLQYTNILYSSCNTTTTFSVWPNPVQDKLFIAMNTESVLPFLIRVFDSKGSLMKVQRVISSVGSNQFNVDMKFLANGVYAISIDSGNGQVKKTVQVVKQ